MNTIFDQTRRMVNSLNNEAARKSASITEQPAEHTVVQSPITMEMIEAVLLSGYYRVRGYSIPASGSAVLEAGQMVPVAWRDGRPVVILQHSVQRAGFIDSVQFGAAKIEELLLLKVNNIWDVWFRDAKTFIPLNLSQYVSHDGLIGPEFETPPQMVRWGQDKNTFAVMTNYNVTAPVALTMSRFYIFRFAGTGRTSASLVNTLSPPPVNTGVAEFSGATVYTSGARDFILASDMDIVMLLNITRDPSNPNNALYVWSATSNQLLSNLAALTGQFPALVPATSTVRMRLQFHPLSCYLLSWVKTDPKKQMVYAHVNWERITSSDPPPGPTQLGTQTEEFSGRYLLWKGDTGGAINIISAQNDQATWSAIIDPTTGGIVSTGTAGRVAAFDILGLGGESYMQAGLGVTIPGTDFILITQTHLIPVFLNLSFPARWLFSFGDVRAGVARLTDGALTLPSGSNGVPGAQFFNASLPYFRWLDTKQLYAVPLTKTLPSSVKASQRDQLVIFLGANITPNIELSPTGKLRKQNQPRVEKLKSWLVTLPLVTDAQNNATEVVLMPDVQRTHYHLIS